MKETIAFLSKLFPDKKVVYFFELKSLIGAYTWGSFINYDKDGNVTPVTKHEIEQRKYYNFKYKGFFRGNGEPVNFPQEVIDLLEKYKTIESDTNKKEKEKDKAYDNYREAADEYIFKNHDLTETFAKIGEHSVCCPFAYSDATVKGMSYEHAGDILFVVTKDAVYFEIERHF